MDTTVPTPQAVTSWKGKADKIIALSAALGLAQSELEAKLKPIREAHEPEIEKLKSDLKKLNAEFEAFAGEHSDSLFAEGSEIRTKIAIITGKLNPPSVELGEGWDEKAAIEALETHPDTALFVAIKKSLDRTALKKALQAGGEVARRLLKSGVGLAQGFSVKVVSKGD